MKGVKELDIKKILKTIKLNEETISTTLGIIVVLLATILVFNYFKKGNKKGEITNGRQTQIEEQKGEEKEGIYTVKKGQSLWVIAEEVYGSGFNWIDIAKANNIKNPNFIEEGQELKLPKTEKRVITTKAIEKIEKSTYAVVKGDNLWEIAVRAYGDGYKWVDIARANKLANPNLIHSGNVLVIPR